jgi:hypothetical protein
MAFSTMRVIVPNQHRYAILNVLDEVQGSSSYPTLSISETNEGFDVRGEPADLAVANDFLVRAGCRAPSTRTVIFDAFPSAEVIVLYSAGQAQVAFSSRDKMCAWLRPKGTMASRSYTQMTIPLDPTPGK